MTIQISMAALQASIDELLAQIVTLQDQAGEDDAQIAILQVQIAALRDQIGDRVAEISTITGGRPAVVPQSYFDAVTAEHADPNMMPDLGTPTHSSVKNGNWSDPTVWSTGTVPGANARVEINHVVTYNATSTAVLNSVHVEDQGTLRLSRTTPTQMWLDTLQTHGFLDGGTEASPAKAEFIFMPSTTAPGITSRLGATICGKTRLHGEKKTARLQATVDIPAGATSADLAGLPTANWKVGDKILFVGTETLPNATTDAQYRGPSVVWATYQGQVGTATDYQVRTRSSGYRQSTDEVRTVTAISGTTLTFDAPLAYAHKVYSGTLKHGQVVTLCPWVANLSRSIIFRSGGDLTNLQKRAHVMFCHEDDIQVRYVECRDTGRSTTDPSLVRPDGVLAYASDPAATPAPATITNPNNVRGRYGLHVHGTGAYFGRKQVVVQGCSVWALDEPIPGWGLVHHNSRCAFEDNVVYNARGAGIVSEFGNEIGQWINNTVAWCRGDGFPTGWGDRAEYWPNHNGHMGVGYENQARQILQQGNIASCCAYGWLYHQQHTGNPTSRSVDAQSLRFRDPIAQGGEDQNPWAVSWPDMRDVYHADQAQIPDFINNACYATGAGFAVMHRHMNDRYDQTPLIMRGFHCVNVGSPFSITNYTLDYSVYDCLWIGTNGSAANLGQVTMGFNFVNCLLRNFATGFKDNGIGVNYNGLWIDCSFENVATPFTHFNATMTTDPALSSKKDIMGPWTNIVKTGTATWTLRARTYENLDSANLPQTYPLPILFGGLSAPSGAATPSFYLDPASDLTKPATARGGIAIAGIIRDSAGDRRFPDWQSSETFPSNMYLKPGRKAHYMTGVQLVERNGCWNDAGQWKSRLWFVDHDRFTGQYFRFSIDILLGTDYDPAFLAANVVDPTLKPDLPLKPERLRTQ